MLFVAFIFIHSGQCPWACVFQPRKYAFAYCLNQYFPY
ncbi:MAG: hypothetical protein AVDCRST_MAG56-7948 [uncultured Cytophagales bacterium]|uniref:Uncharacterized protein n=1 Tax=uncultured Cytophagales bacterium TaxID=158755 RepID=A0A6J4LX90_9SPHI|nr:MAG: hypothetical protein AVDCRST_MAG56-7948 [uncultured Cytophagales bacterium]